MTETNAFGLPKGNKDKARPRTIRAPKPREAEPVQTPIPSEGQIEQQRYLQEQLQTNPLV